MIGFPVIALLLAVKSVSAADFPAGVLATGTMGVTNPPQATMGTPINQNSDARLLTDWCLFAPATPNTKVSDGEVVAWCTKPRNNARLIPDGTLTGVQFLKNDFYVQVMAIGDFTKLNLQAGDSGGELDPHGAEGTGNPIGGNVTSAITGTDQHFAEWMLYTYVCINANSTYSAAAMCWHELDIMGCEFVMPGNYNFDKSFESCDADVAYPPGWYPTVINGTPTFSTFAQRFTGTLNDGKVYTVEPGDLSTPAGPFTTPKSSNCVPTATVSNGIDLADPGASHVTATSGGATNTALSKSGAPTNTGTGTGVKSSQTGSGSSPTSSSAATSVAPLRMYHEGITVIALISGIAAVALWH
ncbi:hypothetical protein C8J56DRAFT_1004500 [Mycena floridula]|nr:hypothetical protein C8J56DRAFT_1004500 [Mycena floridula]